MNAIIEEVQDLYLSLTPTKSVWHFSLPTVEFSWQWYTHNIIKPPIKTLLKTILKSYGWHHSYNSRFCMNKSLNRNTCQEYRKWMQTLVCLIIMKWSFCLWVSYATNAQVNQIGIIQKWSKQELCACPQQCLMLCSVCLSSFIKDLHLSLFKEK